MKIMFRTLMVAGSLCVAAGSLQAFPERPMTLIVPFGAASSVDINARDFAQSLGGALHQTVIVDNRPGAEGTIGAMAVLNARADGHTLMFTSSSIPVLEPVMRKEMRFDPVEDFTPICIVGTTSNVVNITGDSPIKSIQELIAAAKAEPGKLSFGYSTASTRLAGELFQQATGVELLDVPYKTSANGMADVAGGQVDLIFIDDFSAASFYQSGKLRPLAVAGKERISALPDTPSAAEVGMPGYEIYPWFGVYASAKTPPEIVAQLRKTMTEILASPEGKANLAKRGLKPMTACGEAMREVQKNEIEFWRGVIDKAGIEKL